MKSEVSERYTLILEPISKRVNVPKNSSIYDALLALNYPISALCGGKGTCGKCIIKTIENESNLSPPTKNEIKQLGRNKISEGYRLACESYILGTSRIYLTESFIAQRNRILIDSDLQNLRIQNNIELQTDIKKLKIKIAKANLAEPRNDFQGLIDSITMAYKQNDQNKERFQINQISVQKESSDNLKSKAYVNSHRFVDDRFFQISKKLPEIMRQNNGEITAYFRRIDSDKWKLFDVDSYDPNDRIFGLALDVGTTTIVGYLINIESGELTAISAILNPQVAIGEDIVSRITYIKDNDAQQKAQDLLIKGINQILKDCCKKSSITENSVKDIVVVGNTGIHHMLFGLPSQYLATAPFVPVFKAPLNISAVSIGIHANPNVNVYSPPVIAGYVGTDTISCVVASRIDKFKEYSLLIDIGTNGELILGDENGLVSGSCAAGSALEGAQIQYGMRASEGSIESVVIDPDTLDPKLGIIGNISPVGICGSGLIDVVAEMLRTKIITRAGKFNSKSKTIYENRRIVKKNNEYHYILFNRKWDGEYIYEGKSVDEITVSQNDIRQLQLAKGAFLSGIKILLNNENKSKNSIKRVVLAGAFGTYINKKNAAFIGLFPDINLDKIFQIGNAAGLGAQLCLKNTELRNFANEIAYKIKYHEIASSPLFQKEYAYSLYFPYYILEDFPSLFEEYKEIPFR